MSAAPSSGIVIPDLLQGEWTTALICTYGASLTFFETRLMSQLAQVPLRIILADSRQLASSLGEAARTGQRHRLANKAYVAAPVRHPRAAHAKLMLLLGPASGHLTIGSGNLGYDGYASPRELWRWILTVRTVASPPKTPATTRPPHTHRVRDQQGCTRSLHQPAPS